MDPNTANALMMMQEKLNQKGYDARKTRVAVEAIQTSMAEAGSAGKITAANKAATSLANSVVGSIDKFESGDSNQIASGIFDIVGSISEFSALAGPNGMAVAAVIGPVCTLLSGILGRKKEENQVDILERVIKEALAVQTDNELKSYASGEMKEMNESLGMLVAFSQLEELGKYTKEVLSDRQWFMDGVNFMGRLWYFIEKDIATGDRAAAARVAKYLYCYSAIGSLRAQQLALLVALYHSMGAPGLAKVAEDRLEKMTQDVCKTVLRNIGGMPSKENHMVYGQIHLSLTQQERSVIEEYRKFVTGLRRGFLGKTVLIKNVGLQKETLLSCTGKKKSSRIPMRISHKVGNDTKFRVFGSDSLFEIFALYSGGYVYAADYHSGKGYHLVNAWAPGNRINQGTWVLEENGTIFNTKQKEILFPDFADKKKTVLMVMITTKCKSKKEAELKKCGFIWEQVVVDN